MAGKKDESEAIIKALQAEFSVKAEELIEQDEAQRAAVALFIQYNLFRKAGFPRWEAMELIKAIVTAGIRNDIGNGEARKK